MAKKNIEKNKEETPKKNSLKEKQKDTGIKKSEVKKDKAKKEFFNDIESSAKLFQSDSEEELEEIIEHEPRRRFRFLPVLSSNQEPSFEEAFEEPNVNLEQNLKDIPFSKQQTEFSSSYALAKDMNYGINKYSAKSSYETPEIMSAVPAQRFDTQMQPQNPSAWKDMSNAEPSPKPKQETGRNRDYEPKSEKRKDVW